MAKPGEVLELLCPGIEYVLIGQNYEDIDWLGNDAPITKSEYEKGFAKADALIAEKQEVKAQAKSDLLDRLGITEDEAKLLLS